MLVEDAFIDLTSVPCPINFVRAKLMIDTLRLGQILKIELDLGEPHQSVIKSMQEEGHEIIQETRLASSMEIFIKKN